VEVEEKSFSFTFPMRRIEKERMLATSQSLLERLRDRADNQAWQQFLTVYQPWLRGWLSRHELQQADVEDVLQEIFVAVSAKVSEFVHNGHPGAFRTWLRTILTNRVRHFLRGQQNRQAVGSPQSTTDWVDQLADPQSDLTRQWDQEHDQQIVRRLLASIQPEFNSTTWQVFQMLVLDDRPVAEVAQHFQFTPNTVYVAKARVLARLRAELRGFLAF
jgi:RNA polymerase sigma-70 factor, ECF subfamily